jgi:hypothetical protein
MAVVANAKRRQVDLRARLPETLRAHGVIEPAQVGKIKSDVGSARAIEQ